MSRALALALKAARTYHHGPAFMALEAADSDFPTCKANGCTHALVRANWDAQQTSDGGAVSVTTMLASMYAAASAGLKITLEVGLHYPPTFVQTGVPKFKDEAGTEWSASNASGKNVRDWVWSATGRAYVKDYLDKLFAQVPWAMVDKVRVGGLSSGELQFPYDGSNIHWQAFSSPAQGGGDLAAGMSAAGGTDLPAAGYSPQATPAWGDDDTNFVTWYNQSLVNWMLWYIAQHRAHFKGPIYVLHPGAGLRRNSQTPTSAGQGDNYRTNVCQGLDWYAQIAAYPDANVWPYSTWADSAAFWGAAPYDDANDGNAAPFYHLLRVAKLYGRTGRIWGENSGGQTNTDMTRVFTMGAAAFGYEGINWMNAAALTAGTSVSWAHFKALVEAF